MGLRCLTLQEAAVEVQSVAQRYLWVAESSAEPPWCWFVPSEVDFWPMKGLVTAACFGWMRHYRRVCCALGSPSMHGKNAALEEGKQIA